MYLRGPAGRRRGPDGGISKPAAADRAAAGSVSEGSCRGFRPCDQPPDEAPQMVSTINLVTMYGSQLALGRRSSR